LHLFVLYYTTVKSKENRYELYEKNSPECGGYIIE